MFTKGEMLACVGILLVFTLSFSGFVHATTPHSHDDRHGQESLIWGDLHGVLSHVGKKFLAVVAKSLLFVVLGLLIVRGSGNFQSLLFAFISARDPVFGEPLRRGIVAHRTFR